MKEQLNTTYYNEQLGNYRILRYLGHGGFANVYLGKHIYLHTRAAIKVLHAGLADDEIRRFYLEAQYMMRMRHPHIVRMLEFGVKEGTPFLVMEYAPNGTLHDYFLQGIKLPVGTILPYIIQVADALQYIHDRGLIHCDLKPANILLGFHKEAWLSDFGIAVALCGGAQQQEQGLRGTAAYMAPELILGNAHLASDQYALAILAYEWLCGERPFTGNAMQVCYQHLHNTPPSLRKRAPSVSHAVEQVVMQALAKDPSQRFASVKDFAGALKQASQQKQPKVLSKAHVPILDHLRVPLLHSAPETG